MKYTTTEIAAVAKVLETLVSSQYVTSDKTYTDVVRLITNDKIEARIALSFELHNLGNFHDVATELSTKLRDSILNSDCHKSHVQELNDEIKMLQNQIKELNDVVKELKPFKAHFDFQYELQHGKKRE